MTADERAAVITRAEQLALDEIGLTLNNYQRGQRRNPKDWLGGAGMAYLRDVPRLRSMIEKLLSLVRTTETERDKWVDNFNRSEQFQDGPTKRAEAAEAAVTSLTSQLAALEAERDTLKAERDAIQAQCESAKEQRDGERQRAIAAEERLRWTAKARDAYKTELERVGEIVGVNLEVESRLEAVKRVLGTPNTPDFWRCKTCGCVWRDNHDGSVSLGSAKQISCALCEDKTDQECEPLYRQPRSLDLTALRGLSAKWRQFNIDCAEANDYGTCADELDALLDAAQVAERDDPEAQK